MATEEIRISQLPPVSAARGLDGTEPVIVVQDGQTRRGTTQMIADMVADQADARLDELAADTIADITAAAAQASADAAAVTAGLGYLPPVAFAAGITVSTTRVCVSQSGVVYAPAAGVSLPFTTTATFNPSQWRVVQGVAVGDLAAAAGAGMVGFRGASAAATARTVQSKVRDTVSLSDFFGDGDKSVDATAAFNAATAYLAAGNGGEILVDFSPNIWGAVNIPSNVTVRGKNKRHTIVRLRHADAAFVSIGNYRANDGTDDNRTRVVFTNLRIDGGNVARNGIHIRAGSGWVFDNIDIRGTVQEAILAQQFWDSDFFACFFGSGSSTHYAVRMYSGTTDNVNNIRFDGCTFEGCPKGAVVIAGETTSAMNTNYSVSFNNCKMENCGNLGDPIVFVESGVLLGLTITGTGGVIVMEHVDSTILSVSASASCRSVSLFGLLVSGRSGLTSAPKLCALQNAIGFAIERVRANFPVAATDYKPVSIGANCNQYYCRDVSVNNIQVNAFLVTSGDLVRQSPTEFYSSDSNLRQMRREGFGAWREGITSAGDYQVSDVASGLPFMTLSRTSSPPLFRSEQRFACPGAWDKAFVLGTYRLWVDAAGKLRIKSSNPTSDTDGTIVGTQTT